MSAARALRARLSGLSWTRPGGARARRGPSPRRRASRRRAHRRSSCCRLLIVLKLAVTRKIGPLRPAGNQQLAPRPTSAARRRRRAATPRSAKDGERREARGIGVGQLEPCGQAHLETPWRAGDPAVFGEIIGGRADRVGRALPDVAAAVALEIDGVFEEARGHELGLAHRAGPRAAHLARARRRLPPGCQRGDQFVAEIVAAKMDEGEAGEGADDIVRPAKTPKSVSMPQMPISTTERRRRRPLPPWRARRAPSSALARPRSMRARRDRAGKILPDRLDEFGLLLGVGDDLGDRRSTPLKARSKVARETPRASASGQSPATKARKAASSSRRFGGGPRARAAVWPGARSRRRGVAERTPRRAAPARAAAACEAAPDGRSEASSWPCPRWTARAA